MKMIAGIILATIAIFIWSFFFWALSPLPGAVMKQAHDDGAAGTDLLAHLPESGTYFIPGMYNDREKLEELHRKGPIAMIHISREGMEIMPASTFLYGIVHYLITMVLVTLLFKMLLPALQTYLARVGFAALAGFTAAFFTHVGMSIWWHVPWNWFLVYLLYEFTAWIVAGLVLAAFVTPGTRTAA